MSVNYSNSKIYKIEPKIKHEEGEIFIGSTIRDLEDAFNDHVKNHYYKKHTTKKYISDVASSILFEKYGEENCKITLIETFDAGNSKTLLTYRVGQYINKNKCVNKASSSKGRIIEGLPELKKL